MNEVRRQKLLELYGIGVNKLLYTGDKGMWFGIYCINNDEYETNNYMTRREAEDVAISEVEKLIEHPDQNSKIDKNFPTFVGLAKRALENKGPREKNITIKIEALTARMMIDNEDCSSLTGYSHE